MSPSLTEAIPQGHISEKKTVATSVQKIQPEAGPVLEPFSAPALVDGVLRDTQEVDIHTQTSEKILAVLKPYHLTKSVDVNDRWELGAIKFISVIRNFVSKGQTVQMCLPAFPWKSANKVYKVLGTLPDKAEELALKRLNGICEAIGEVYKPGAELLIISDGLLYNDLFTIPDRDVWAYGEGLRALAAESGCTHIRFTRLKDLVNIPNLPDKLEEITYIANALNFRLALLNRYGKTDLDVTKEIAEKDDTRLTYCGYSRFLENDLQYIFKVGGNMSRRKYRRDVKYVAKQMIYRGYAFGMAINENFPDYLRLSIHQSTGEHKVSINLLPTKTSYTTPWHCSVALLADGSFTSGPKGDFEDNPKFELVYEKDGRPSYFREMETGAVEDVDDY
ncbi:Pyoverdine biosynthesis [Penicillium griseofulvum]|uniref:Pyoverdine biosynthesis n=1 Tax=Penicillium patulum TaxID=5078 RepID=A0A135LNY2_PENPA|nr:Pyoverdine biosynthesis [Penicillium griseofulvum]KXG50670.1 Pyoverdine biosynthesis [Penicillium griseofulvum]